MSKTTQPLYTCDTSSCVAPVEPFWYFFVSASSDASTGLVNAGTSYQLPATDVIWLNHTSVTFYLPPFEGNVSFTLSYQSGDGSAVLPVVGKVQFTAPPPEIFSMSTLPGTFATVDDPCTALSTGVLPVAPTAQDALNINQLSACLNASYLVHPERPPLQPPSQPCFRANPSSTVSQLPSLTGVSVRFQVNGRRLGNGTFSRMALYFVSALKDRELGFSGIEPLVKDQSLGGERARHGIVQCSPVQSLTVLVDSTRLVCAVSGDLPRGPVVLYAYVAFSVVTSHASSTTLTAACPCGSFSDSNGTLCQECPVGGSCGGGLDQPRAVAGYWKIVRGECEFAAVTSTCAT